MSEASALQPNVGETGVPVVADLSTLEADVERALATGDVGSLEILGYGEISCVVSWPAGPNRVACKRLPLFPDVDRLERYRTTMVEYLRRLGERGVHVVPTDVQSVTRNDRRIAVYCVQPILPGSSLAPKRVAALPEPEALALMERIVGAIVAGVDARVGVDGQLSNWAEVDGTLQFLDVSTPMLRDDGGRDLLDTDLFIASLPWLLRGIVRRFVLASILDKYFDRRGVLLDLLGNLVKEKLDRFLPAMVDRVNVHVDKPITEVEARAYYASDARLWGILQRLRRIDRAWQRSVRRRTYPFLLPGKIER